MEAMAMSVESPLQLCTLHNLWMHTGTRLQRQYHKTKMEKSVKQEIMASSTMTHWTTHLANCLFQKISLLWVHCYIFIPEMFHVFIGFWVRFC